MHTGMLWFDDSQTALNVKINLNSLGDTDFVGWKREDVESLLRTCRAMLEETMEMVGEKVKSV